MDALELLKNWPGWAKAGAETILASPAWRMAVRMGEQNGILTFADAPLNDTIDLEITLDDEPHVLSLADSPLYPDLHLLWGTRAGLPPEVLLALLEKECGGVFSLLENTTRCLLGVKGLASAPSPEARAMTVTMDASAFSFALDLPPGVRTQFGRLENLDVSHPVIRELTRPARVDYCSLILTEEERAGLVAGDHLIVPDDFANTQKWIVEDPVDEAVHVCSVDTRDISFGSFADDRLPAIPGPGSVILLSRNVEIGTATVSHVGLARTVRMDGVRGAPAQPSSTL